MGRGKRPGPKSTKPASERHRCGAKNGLRCSPISSGQSRYLKNCKTAVEIVFFSFATFVFGDKRDKILNVVRIIYYAEILSCFATFCKVLVAILWVYLSPLEEKLSVCINLYKKSK